MKLSTRILSVLITAVFLMTALAVPLSAADNSAAAQSDDGGDARYTQKIVSVLYDNSSSMDVTDNRDHYAEYATRMLMALLNPSDVLVVTPMNVNLVTIPGKDKDEYTYDSDPVSSISSGVVIDLSSSDREGEINKAFNNGFHKTNSSTTTPGDSIGVALEQLTSRGLVDNKNIAKSADNIEYWLVIMTDGSFNGSVKDKPSISYSSIGPEASIKYHIDNYDSVNTIFVGLGSSAPGKDKFPELSKKSNFSFHRADRIPDIVSTMQDVSNQLSGRYALDAKQFTVDPSDSKKVTVNLDKTKCALNSVSVIAQDCGAKLESVTYNGKSLGVTNPCVITTDGLGIKNGYTGVIYRDKLPNGDPQYFNGGTLTLEFSEPVSNSDLTVLVEPALEIDAYVEYRNGTSWVKIDDWQTMNQELKAGDIIRVKYDVYEKSAASGGNKKPVDLKDIFGETKEEIRYIDSKYEAGKEIVLQEATTYIDISISIIKDGNVAYKFYDRLKCIIFDDPDFLEVKAEHGGSIPSSTKTADIMFSVFVDKQLTSKSELEKAGYKVEITEAKDSKGNKVSTVITEQPDGRIKVNVKANDGAYGEYRVCLRVTAESGVYRDATGYLDYARGLITIDCTAPSEIEAGKTQAELVYTVCVDDVKLDETGVKGLELSAEVTKPGGGKVNLDPTIDSDGKIHCILTVENMNFGSYTVKLTASNGGVHVTDTRNIMYSLNGLDIKHSWPSEFNSSSTSLKTRYEIFIDGKPLTEEEVNKLDEISAVLEKPDGSETKILLTVESDGKIKCSFSAEFMAYGDYKITFSVTENRVVYDKTSTIKYVKDAVEIQHTWADTVPAGSTRLESEYTVWVGKDQLNKEQLEKYGISLYVNTDGGANEDLKYEITDRGTVKTSLDVSEHGYGLYKVVMKFEIPGNAPEINEHKIIYYPKSIDVKAVGNGYFSASQHQMESNENGFKFELYADGNPFAFDNRITTKEFKMNGIDISDFVNKDGYILTYVPKAEHFNGQLKTGTVNITVTVTLDVPNVDPISDSASQSFEITETVYEIKLLPTGNREIEKFKLDKLDAVICYTVSRDGTLLTEDELRKELENGKLKITDEKGTFDSGVCKGAVTVEPVDGTPAVVFRPFYDSIWVVLDWYRAMPITKGDKPITASYYDAACTENLTVKTDVGFICFLIFLAILAIYLAVHYIACLIGCFLCKPLPSGVLLDLSVTSTKSEKPVLAETLEVNIGPSWYLEKIKWHILRWVPFVNVILSFIYLGKFSFLYDQLPLRLSIGAYDIKYMYCKNTRAREDSENYSDVTPGDPCFVFESSVYKLNRESSGRVEDFKRKLAGYDPKTEDVPQVDSSDPITGKNLLTEYSSDGKVIAERTPVSIDQVYGTYTQGLKKLKLQSIIVFCEK